MDISEIFDIAMTLFTGIHPTSLIIGMIIGAIFNGLAKILIAWRFPGVASFFYKFDKVQKQLLDIIISTSDKQHTKESLEQYAEATGRKTAKELIKKHKLK